MKERLIHLMNFIHPFLIQLKDRYWFIGSSSLHLQNIETTFNDVDLLTSRRDAQWLIEQLKAYRVTDLVKEDSNKYRSEFSQFTIANSMLEVMGDLEIKKDNEWIRVIDVVQETDWIHSNEYSLPVPSLKDQLTIYKLLDRKKD